MIKRPHCSLFHAEEEEEKQAQEKEVQKVKASLSVQVLAKVVRKAVGLEGGCNR